jgi:activator of HSP90 ATPase
MPKNIKQNVVFNTNPTEVYNLLMDSKKHSAFTHEPAKISNEVGGKVSCYSNYIEAINIELIEDKRIVQAWRGSDWNNGDWSLVIFNLEKMGKNTQLTFEHVGIPDEHAAAIKDGWTEHYWLKMKEYIKYKA